MQNCRNGPIRISIPIEKDILKAAGVSAGRVTLGIPGMARAKKIITDYYMDTGKKAKKK